MLNLSCENAFDLRGNEPVGETHFHANGFVGFFKCFLRHTTMYSCGLKCVHFPKVIWVSRKKVTFPMAPRFPRSKLGLRSHPKSSVGKNMATGTFTHSS